MKKLFALTAAVLALACTSCAKKKASTGGTLQPGTLKIGMEIGYPPFEYYAEDGKTLIGFDVELGKEIARRLGLSVEFVNNEWDKIFTGLEENQYDVIISALTITSERRAKYNFSKAYIGNAQSILVHKDSTQDISTPTDLEGLRVGFQDETTSKYYLETLHSEVGLNYEGIGYSTVTEAYDDLKNKKIDAICSDSLVSVKYLSDADNEYKRVWEGVVEEFFGVCMKKDNTELLEQVNRVMDEIIADGTLSKIYIKIFGGDLLYTIKNSPYNR